MTKEIQFTNFTSLIKIFLDGGGSRWEFKSDEDANELEEKVVENVHSNNQQDTVSAESAKKTSKKKKSRKKNRNRSDSVESQGEVDHSKHVNWGNVEEILFSRDIGLGSVPSKGVYPLGLGVFERKDQFTIDIYEELSQSSLREKAKRLGISYVEGGGTVLETRQYDFCGKTNPLFSSLTEEER